MAVTSTDERARCCESQTRPNTNLAPGGMRAIVSVNDDAFLTAADITTNMHLAAVELLLRRCRPAT